MRKLILRILFSKYEITLIHESLQEMKYRYKTTVNESCQDAVRDIDKIKNKLPKGNKYVFD